MKIKNMTLNFGPQHPAAHGVLRVVIESMGEIIQKADPHIGLLHRGTEKLIEYKNYLQALPYFDRLDYVSAMSQEYTYSIGVEDMLNLKVSLKTQLSRLLFCELTRILNHLLAITTHALDVGALTPFLWGFEIREKLMEFYENVCGGRLHTAFIRPGHISQDIPKGLLFNILFFIENLYLRFDEIEDLLSTNRIWQTRLRNVGIVSYSNALDYGFSGIMARGSGFFWDLRSINKYDILKYFFEWSMMLGLYGDCYDRYMLRMFEMRQSTELICRAVKMLIFLSKDKLDTFFGTIYLENNNNKVIRFGRSHMKSQMEYMIHHFKSATEGFFVEKEDSYVTYESPKGEFGVGLHSDNTSKPMRCRIKAPGFLHLQGLDFMSRDLLLSDFVAIIGTQDLVFGEIDR